MYRTCLLCGSDRIIPDLRIQDAGAYPSGNHKVTVETKPTALLFRGAESGLVLAHVCGDCGYTVFFADRPQQLYGAYQQAAESRKKE